MSGSRRVKFSGYVEHVQYNDPQASNVLVSSRCAVVRRRVLGLDTLLCFTSPSLVPGTSNPDDESKGGTASGSGRAVASRPAFAANLLWK